MQNATSNYLGRQIQLDHGYVISAQQDSPWVLVSGACMWEILLEFLCVCAPLSKWKQMVCQDRHGTNIGKSHSKLEQ